MDASHANALAYLALLFWAAATVGMFAFLRPQVAAAVAFVGAMLFLPERVQFDLPAVPPLNKWTLTSVAVLVGCLMRCPHQIARARPGRGIDLIFLVIAVSAMGTILTNRDPLTYGPVELVGLEPYDAVSVVSRDLLAIGVPFFIGRALFRTVRDLRQLLIIFVAAALIYTPFILVEVRMSPQWHLWIYGFHQHSFEQAIRFGGYRPMVFMAHGLAVALFITAATFLAASLGRARLRVFALPNAATVGWLALILALCKSTAAWAYGILFLPAVALLSARSQSRIAVLISFVVIAYPALRATDLFPTAALVDAAAGVAPARAASVEFRFEQEDQLFSKARERPLFGWGSFGRNHVYNERGRDISVTDGHWIILLGMRGIIGWLAAFALLIVPVLAAHRAIRHVRGRRSRLLLAGLALALSVYTVDLIPNGLFSEIPYFFGGALWSLSQTLRRKPGSKPRRVPDLRSAATPSDN